MTARAPSPLSTTAGPTSGPDAASITQTARAGGRDAYLAALLAPQPVQADLLALTAFAAELARIPTLVTEPTMGEIRLQWWRDVLHAAAAARDAAAAPPASGHAIADALGTALRRHRLSLPVLLAMTEAHAFDLYADPMPDERAFESYLDKTAGASFALALHMLGADPPAALADHAGRAYGRMRVLATLPWWLSRGRNPLPETLLRSIAGSADALRLGQWGPPTQAVVAAVAGEAEAERARAVQLARQLPRAHRVALLPLATISPLLRALRHPRHDPLRQMTDIAPLSRIAAIARAHCLGL